jgi:hypothetical protein
MLKSSKKNRSRFLHRPSAAPGNFLLRLQQQRLKDSQSSGTPSNSCIKQETAPKCQPAAPTGQGQSPKAEVLVPNVEISKSGAENPVSIRSAKA